MQPKFTNNIKASLLVVASTWVFAIGCGSHKSQMDEGASVGGQSGDAVTGDNNQTPQNNQNTTNNDGGGSNTTNPTDPNTGNPTDSNTGTQNSNMPAGQTYPKVGLRNFQQINATMAALTGIPRTTAAIKLVYDPNGAVTVDAGTSGLSTSLPTDNDVRAFLGSSQVAIYKLAVEYCDALVKNPTASTAVFGVAIAATSTPATVFTAAGKQQLADKMITRFWGKDLESLPPHDQTVASIVKLIDDIMVGKDPNTATVTPGVVTAVCTAALASAPISLF